MLECADEKQTLLPFEELKQFKRSVAINEGAIAIIEGVGTYANANIAFDDSSRIKNAGFIE